MKWFFQKVAGTDTANRNVMLCTLLVLGVFVAAVAMSEPLPSEASSLTTPTLMPTRLPAQVVLTANPTGEETTPTRTPVPRELLENADATDGIIIGTVVLVIIVLAGTIAGINLRRKQHPDA